MKSLCVPQPNGNRELPGAEGQTPLPPPPFDIVGWDESDDRKAVHADFLIQIQGERWRVHEDVLSSYGAFVLFFALEGIVVSWPALELRPRSQRRLLWLQAIADMVAQVRAKDRAEYEAMRGARKGT